MKILYTTSYWGFLLDVNKSSQTQILHKWKHYLFPTREFETGASIEK